MLYMCSPTGNAVTGLGVRNGETRLDLTARPPDVSPAILCKCNSSATPINSSSPL